MNFNSFKTAISRSNLSRPARLFKSYFEGKVLDCGCGKGSDADILGIAKYDPHYFPKKPKIQYDTVLLIYVLNTTPYPSDVLKQVIPFVKRGGLLMVATRSIPEVKRNAKKSDWKVHGRGWLTSKGTFQRGLSHQELVGLLKWEDILLQGTKEFSYVIARKP